MKKGLFTLTALFLFAYSFAQTPQGINYQTMIRDFDGTPLINSAFTLKIVIKENTPDGNIIYCEIHNLTSNNFGLVTLVIGRGTPDLGEFAQINWGSGAHYFESSIDLKGSGNFQLIGTTQFLSVPYAFYSEKTGDTTLWQKNETITFYNKGQVSIGTNEPENSALLDIKSTEKGLLQPRLTHAEINAIVNPANGLSVFCTDCGVNGEGAFFGFINGQWNSILTCIPPSTPSGNPPLSNISEIVWNWNTVIGATGYKWNAADNCATAIDMGNLSSYTETGLTCGTEYKRYVWAYNSCGISAPLILQGSTDEEPPESPEAGEHEVSLFQIVWNWNPVIGAVGYKWNFFDDFDSAEDMGSSISKIEDGLQCNTLYNRFVWTYNECGYSEATILTGTTPINPPVQISISASSNPVCAGAPVTFTSISVNEGINPIYHWIVNGNAIQGAANSTFTYTPSNNDQISCQLISSIPCSQNNPALSNVISMIVNPLLPVGVTISPNVNPVCAGYSVTFTAYPTNGGTSPLYQWKKNGVNVGTNSLTYSFVPSNGNVITCLLTSSEPCVSGNPATSNSVTITLTQPLPVSVTITTTTNPVCQGSTATFIASPTNGGTNPSYQWKVNGINQGTNNPVFSHTPANGDQVKCVLNSNLPCKSGNPATSNIITMVVNPMLPVSVSINASANSICEGTNVTFTATQNNGGTNPIYQWKVNGINQGSNSQVFSYLPSNNDLVTCTLTSSEVCTSGNPSVSNTISMVVFPNQPVGISITASASTVCEGSTVIFNASATNGGTNPVYHWKVNNLIVGTNSSSYSYTPQNGDAITCELTSSINCTSGNPAVSNEIIMEVNPLLPVTISIAASENPVCTGQSVIFTATYNNGGTSPFFLWFVNGVPSGTNSPTFNYIPANGEFISCILISNASCNSGSPATSNTISMVVNPILPVSVSIASSSNPVCQGTSVTFTATPTNGGTNPNYLWKVDGNIVGNNNPSYSFIPDNGNSVTCVLTSNESCVSGNPSTSELVTVTTISPPGTPSVGSHIPSLTQIIWKWNQVVTATGYKWNTENNYLTAVDLGSSLSKTETGLVCNTAYYRYIWAYNDCGNSSVLNLDQSTTSCPIVPTVTTAEPSAITTTTAISGGNVLNDGGAIVTARGVCWSTSQNPTIVNSKTIDGAGLGSYISNLTGLTQNTAYYVRAYATNSVGTAYGNELSFTTSFATYNIKLLVVGGGGGGSPAYGEPGNTRAGGGGGAGDYTYFESYTITSLTPIPVTVGTGGLGTYPNPADGASSSFENVTSCGGTRGFGCIGANACNGFEGGFCNEWAGGGGGGQGSIGNNGNGQINGGNGGVGISNDISGSSVIYAGGGGGGRGSAAGSYGTSYGVYGGGGRGSENCMGGCSGENGKNGIVIIRYTSPVQRGNGGTVTTIGGDFIHTFTSSGTFTPY